MTTSEAPQALPSEEPADHLIEFRNVHRQFDKGDGRSTLALAGVTFGVKRGEFVSVLGPSGCGKSTLLNLTAGLMVPSDGAVVFDGTSVGGINTRVGYVTQQDALLPWRTVAQNIALPLQIRKQAKEQIEDRVRQAVTLIGLEGFEDHYPAELSGGMRRRVSLARTMVYEPDTLLLDEPFGALDAQLRLVLQTELSEIVENTGVTVVFVTHDVSEAVALSDRVVVLTQRPAVVQLEIPIELARPRNVVGIHREAGYAHYFDQLWASLRTSSEAP